MTNLSGFDLNLLRVLDALLRDGSTVGAAARIGLSQPAVSAALGRLRLALDDPLFVRHGQGLVATDRALALKDPVHAALAAVAELIEGPVAFDPAEADTVFRLSGTDFFARMLIPGLARRLGQVAPGVRVQLLDLVRDTQFDRLEKDGIDFALQPKANLPSWAVQQVLFDCPFVVIARQDHPWLRGVSPEAPMPMDLYLKLGHILISPEGRLAARGDAALAAVGKTRRVVMSMPYFSGVARTVADSDLIALMPLQYARKAAADVGLLIYEPPFAIDPVSISLVWHRRRDADAAHRWMRGLIVEVLSTL